MIVVRFKVQCQKGKSEHALAVFEDVIGPSRALDGVVSFGGRDLADPNSIVAVEVFRDRAAFERQGALPEVARVMAVLPKLIASSPEATLFHVSSCEALQ